MRAAAAAVPTALMALGLLAAPAAAPRAAAEDLSSLLAGIGGGAGKPKGEVRVSAWAERGPAGGPELVVRVEPQGAAKLVAEPGVTVVPVAREGVTWPAGDAASDAGGRTYFDAPVELRLPFEAGAGDARPVEASVEYAYCLVGYQCLFGEAKVSALPPALPACVAAQAGATAAAC